MFYMKKKKWIFIGSACLIGLLGLWGLLTRSTQAAPSVTQQLWSWEKYPQVERFMLGQLRSEALPSRSLRYTAGATGTLSLLVTQAESEIEKGALFGALDEQTLQAEKRNLEIAEQILDFKEYSSRTLELPQQILKAERETEEARRKMQLLRMVTEDPDLKALAAEFGESNLENVNALTLARAEQELNILEAQLSAIKGEDVSTFELDLESKRLEFNNRKADFQKKLERSQLKATFSGSLQINPHFTLGEEKQLYPVSMGQEIATLRDLSEVQLMVMFNHPAWLQLPKDKIEVTAHSAQGHTFTARYHDQRIEQRGTSDVRHYLFLIPQSEASTARNLIGSSPQVDVYIQLEKPAYKVPKTDIALYGRDRLSGRRWDEVVKGLWPTARIVAEGQTELAIELIEGQGALAPLGSPTDSAL